MTRVYVIDPEARPSRDWSAMQVENPIRPFDAGLRIMEAEIVGWQSGRVVRVAIFGNTAIGPLVRANGAVPNERWQVFQDDQIGGWVAWVVRPKDDDRSRRDAIGGRVELLIVGCLIFIAAAIAALVLIVLPQCTGGNFG